MSTEPLLRSKTEEWDEVGGPLGYWSLISIPTQVVECPPGTEVELHVAGAVPDADRLLFIARRCDEFSTIDFLGMTITLDWVGDDGHEVEQLVTPGEMFARLGAMIREAVEGRQPAERKARLP